MRRIFQIWITNIINLFMVGAIFQGIFIELKRKNMSEFKKLR